MIGLNVTLGSIRKEKDFDDMEDNKYRYHNISPSDKNIREIYLVND
jgi:hypothetical protein